MKFTLYLPPAAKKGKVSVSVKKPVTWFNPVGDVLGFDNHDHWNNTGLLELMRRCNCLYGNRSNRHLLHALGQTFVGPELLLSFWMVDAVCKVSKRVTLGAAN
jgi:hypothetical protein